jgi:hypothetical protein
MFGLPEPKLTMIIGFAFFLETAYKHESEHPLINILNIKIDENQKNVSFDSEGINIMYTLLNPQEVPATVVPNNICG